MKIEPKQKKKVADTGPLFPGIYLMVGITKRERETETERVRERGDIPTRMVTPRIRACHQPRSSGGRGALSGIMSLFIVNFLMFYFFWLYFI